MNTIEKKVADTILEQPTDFIKVGETEYTIAPPTTGTLILVSGLVSTLPIVKKDADNALYEVLSTAKDLSIIGKIAATLILGAKRIKERRTAIKTEAEQYTRWSWRKMRTVTMTKTTTSEALEADLLAERLLDEVDIKTLSDIVVKCLGKSQFGDFFVLTTSLSEVNLLKRTKEVETASGD